MDINKNLEKLNKIGIALSSEKNLHKLLEMIVDEAMDITNADAGTLYLMIDNKTRLKYEIIKNKTLKMNFVNASEEVFYPVKLYLDDSETPNLNMVSAYCALKGITINVKDAYKEKGFDFTGPKNVDKKYGYRSKSTLNVALKDHEEKVIGVLQLWNSTCPETKQIIPFEANQVKLIESLSSQAAIAINNTKLIQTLEDVFKSLIQYTVKAIDARSPHTAGHSSRVAKLTKKLALAINTIDKGIYKDTQFNQDEIEEIWISGLMHDVGKISTPEHILDKRNKIDGERFTLISERFKYIKSIMKLSAKDDNNKLLELEDDFIFIKKINEKGKIFEDEKPKLVEIYNKTYFDGFSNNSYLTEEEYECLNIEKGNLTKEERYIIQDHVVYTKSLLNRLKFPEKLKNVPLYAGAHHENIDGKGYPDGLKGDEIPLPARMLAIADLWDAVTAQDRPYRPPVPDDIACKILIEEVASGKLDANLVDVFIKKDSIWKKRK